MTVTVGGPQQIAAVANTFLSFTGVGFSTGTPRRFQALAGANPPTITGGYARWTEVKRPLARSLTIFDGYDPVRMVVDVVFGAWAAPGWDITDAGGQAVEQNIGALEWMAGSNFQSGPSPAVYVYCYAATGGQSDLIPPQYQSRDHKHEFAWVITQLAWGTSHRNTNGRRVWQEATITLEGYLGTAAAPHASREAAGGYFVSRPGKDRPILIAAAATVNSPNEDHQILAGRIAEDPHNNPCHGRPRLSLNGKGLRFRIPHGVHVWIPGHVVN